mmetsp:Transcript_32678/g.72054  ORF Transcript_32678/g.72054 Transcript_32678/m.72054 type:complete len:325 (-) Transcript_32678:216-1190(-)
MSTGSRRVIPGPFIFVLIGTAIHKSALFTSPCLRPIIINTAQRFFATLLLTYLHQQHSIDTSVQLGIVGNLSHLTPGNLATGRYESQLTNIHFNDGTLGHYAQIGIQRRTGIFLHAQYIQLECSFQLGMGNIGLLHPQAGRSDESLILGRLAGEAIPDKGAFRNDALPRLVALTARSHNLEHFVVSHGLDLGYRYLPLPRLLLALLLHGVGQDLGTTYPLTVEEVRRHGSIGDSIIVGVLVAALGMLRDGLSHGGLLLEATFVVQFGADSVHLLGEFRSLVSQARLSLPFPFFCIEPTSVQLAVPLHMLVLRHFFGLLYLFIWK